MKKKILLLLFIFGIAYAIYNLGRDLGDLFEDNDIDWDD